MSRSTVCMAGVLIVLAGCNKAPEMVEMPGECGMVYGGTVCTWAQMEGDRVVALGATIPMATVEGVPAEMEMAWPPVPGAVLALPTAAQQATGMTDLTIFWEAHGHPPGPFLTPHFDFHFYGIPAAEREAIDCVDTTKPATLPAGYELPDEEVPGIGTLVGICVPTMGMHSLPSADLTATTLFDATMVVGYNHTQPIFTEPMISRDYLMRKQDFTLPVPALTAASGTHYPSSFQATYDAATQSYRFSFSGFGM